MLYTTTKTTITRLRTTVDNIFITSTISALLVIVFLLFVLSLLLLFLSYTLCIYILMYSILFLLVCFICFFTHSIIEQEYYMYYSTKFVSIFKTGLYLFLVSEIALFGSFFVSYFYCVLNTGIEQGVIPVFLLNNGGNINLLYTLNSSLPVYTIYDYSVDVCFDGGIQLLSLAEPTLNGIKLYYTHNSLGILYNKVNLFSPISMLTLPHFILIPTVGTILLLSASYGLNLYVYLRWSKRQLSLYLYTVLVQCVYLYTRSFVVMFIERILFYYTYISRAIDICGFLPLLCGLFFIYLQTIEYKVYLPATITNAQMSNFFLLTGCHGIHVLIGVFLLYVTQDEYVMFIAELYMRLSHFVNFFYIHFLHTWTIVLYNVYIMYPSAMAALSASHFCDLLPVFFVFVRHDDLSVICPVWFFFVSAYVYYIYHLYVSFILNRAATEESVRFTEYTAHIVSRTTKRMYSTCTGGTCKRRRRGPAPIVYTDGEIHPLVYGKVIEVTPVVLPKGEFFKPENLPNGGALIRCEFEGPVALYGLILFVHHPPYCGMYEPDPRSGLKTVVEATSAAQFCVTLLIGDPAQIKIGDPVISTDFCVRCINPDLDWEKASRSLHEGMIFRPRRWSMECMPTFRHYFIKKCHFLNKFFYEISVQHTFLKRMAYMLFLFAIGGLFVSCIVFSVFLV